MEGERASPVGKPVALFVTCMVDALHPGVARATVEILASLGVPVEIPDGQSCCGQPGFNAGHRREARQVAATWLDAFAAAEVIVTPSGSCAAMVRHEYPRLFADDPVRRAQAERLGARTWELTEYLVDGLGMHALAARLPHPASVAFHDACHGLRLLGLGRAARLLAASVDNAVIVPLPDAEVCCGFGGLFSIKMPEISGAMLRKKTAAIDACPAPTILTGDVGCMIHINGGLEQQGSDRRVRHVAEWLAEAIREGQRGG